MKPEVAFSIIAMVISLITLAILTIVIVADKDEMSVNSMKINVDKVSRNVTNLESDIRALKQNDIASQESIAASIKYCNSKTDSLQSQIDRLDVGDAIDLDSLQNEVNNLDSSIDCLEEYSHSEDIDELRYCLQDN